LHIKIDLKSLAINKASLEDTPFDKYNIDVSLNEIEASETFSKLQFSISFLSEPKNSKIFFDGLVTVKGSESERNSILEQDNEGIPDLLHRIYDELFPMIYMMAKTAQIPSPSIRLSESHEISSSPISKQSEVIEEEPVEEIMEQEPVEKQFETMSRKELNAEYENLDKQYSQNPSTELQEKLERVVRLLQENNAE